MRAVQPQVLRQLYARHYARAARRLPRRM